ncbi:MAG TPA: hypothetical protein VF158_11855 [Longimicrobiales bacterium]
MSEPHRRFGPDPTPAPPDPAPPSGWRLLLVDAVLLFVLAGSLYDIARFREHWPFSPYWMYSHARVARTIEAAQLYGVAADGTGREVLLSDPRAIYPFDITKLRVALERMAADPAGAGRLRAALADCLARYETLRRDGAHDGPPLAGVRLYRAEWTLDPWARNVARPDRRELIAELMDPATGVD